VPILLDRETKRDGERLPGNDGRPGRDELGFDVRGLDGRRRDDRAITSATADQQTACPRETRIVGAVSKVESTGRL
jgi:hypothetical protein